MIDAFLFGARFALELSSFIAGILVSVGVIFLVASFIIATLNKSPSSARRLVCWFKTHNFEEIEVDIMGDPRKSIPVTRCSRCAKRPDTDSEGGSE